MAEDYRLSFSPVLIEDLRAVFGGDRAHRPLPSLEQGGQSPIGSSLRVPAPVRVTGGLSFDIALRSPPCENAPSRYLVDTALFRSRRCVDSPGGRVNDLEEHR